MEVAVAPPGIPDMRIKKKKTSYTAVGFDQHQGSWFPMSRRLEPNPHVGKVVEVQFDDRRWYEYFVREYDSIRERYTAVYSEGQPHKTEQVVKLDFVGMWFDSKRPMRVKRPSIGRTSVGEPPLKLARTYPPPSPPLASPDTAGAKRGGQALVQRQPKGGRTERPPPVCFMFAAE